MSSPAHARSASRMGRVAFRAGVGVVLLTAAGQVGLLGGHDFVFEATVGLLGGVFCLAVAVGCRSRAALVGLALSLLPVAMLVYFLTTTEG